MARHRHNDMKGYEAMTMSMFEDRERAYEAKWAHDEETLFRITARRNLLLGQWAAGKLGLIGAAAQDYTTSLMQAALAEPNSMDEKILRDLGTAGIGVSDQALAAIKKELLAQAQRDVA